MNAPKRADAPPVAERIRMRILRDTHGETGWLTATFRYDPADPFTVSIAFPCNPNDWWAIDRDLLADGMQRPAGEGDVRIRPVYGDYITVEFTSPDGSALLEVPQPAIWHFLRLTYGRVERGAERVDVDGWIGRILAGAS